MRLTSKVRHVFSAFWDQEVPCKGGRLPDIEHSSVSDSATMSHRYGPYSTRSSAPQSLGFWFHASSMVHPCKPDQQNADVYFAGERKLCVCDGVGGVVAHGMVPSAMATAMANDIDEALDYRIANNAQKYDRNTQLCLKSSVRQNEAGGWLRNLTASCFSQTTALGSTVFAVCHLTGTKLDFCTLGDCQIFVFRQCGAEGAREIFRSEAPRDANQVPPQAYLDNPANLSYEHVERVFQSCKYGKIPDMQAGDTVLVASDGVTDNIGNSYLRALVSKAYTHHMNPEDLCEEVVADAISNAYRPNGKPDDTTCAVGYLFDPSGV
jgi:serine/threonine protein phosphatase PrpC